MHGNEKQVPFRAYKSQLVWEYNSGGYTQLGQYVMKSHQSVVEVTSRLSNTRFHNSVKLHPCPPTSRRRTDTSAKLYKPVQVNA